MARLGAGNNVVDTVGPRCNNVGMTTKTDLTRIANLLAADLPNLDEWDMALLDSDQGLIVQERQTCLRYGREDEEMDAVAWLRDGDTLVLWAGNDDDPDMNWPIEIPVGR
jgi:hypothetical protein